MEGHTTHTRTQTHTQPNETCTQAHVCAHVPAHTRTCMHAEHWRARMRCRMHTCTLQPGVPLSSPLPHAPEPAPSPPTPLLVDAVIDQPQVPHDLKYGAGRAGRGRARRNGADCCGTKGMGGNGVQQRTRTPYLHPPVFKAAVAPPRAATHPPASATSAPCPAGAPCMCACAPCVCLACPKEAICAARCACASGVAAGCCAAMRLADSSETTTLKLRYGSGTA